MMDLLHFEKTGLPICDITKCSETDIINWVYNYDAAISRIFV